MKTRLLLLASTGLLVVACGSPPREESSCASVTYPATCTGNPDNPIVNVNRNSLNFAPPSVCAKPGTTIEFRLTPKPKNSLGNAAIYPKDEADDWLKGTNSPDKDKILVPVPDEVSEGAHDYGAFFAEGTCIDPRVEVRR